MTCPCCLGGLTTSPFKEDGSWCGPCQWLISKELIGGQEPPEVDRLGCPWHGIAPQLAWIEDIVRRLVDEGVATFDQLSPSTQTVLLSVAGLIWPGMAKLSPLKMPPVDPIISEGTSLDLHAQPRFSHQDAVDMAQARVAISRAEAMRRYDPREA